MLHGASSDPYEVRDVMGCQNYIVPFFGPPIIGAVLELGSNQGVLIMPTTPRHRTISQTQHLVPPSAFKQGAMGSLTVSTSATTEGSWRVLEGCEPS